MEGGLLVDGAPSPSAHTALRRRLQRGQGCPTPWTQPVRTSRSLAAGVTYGEVASLVLQAAQVHAAHAQAGLSGALLRERTPPDTMRCVLAGRGSLLQLLGHVCRILCQLSQGQRLALGIIQVHSACREERSRSEPSKKVAPMLPPTISRAARHARELHLQQRRRWTPGGWHCTA